MNFAKFNKTRFDYDAVTMEWDKKDKSLWKKVADIFDENDPDKVWTIRSIFTIKKDENHPDMINDEEAIVTCDNYFVNVPHHQLEDAKKMLEDREACEYINDGGAGFRLRPYETSKRKETCYSMVWVDLGIGDEV